jgi:phosphohistidine phosphatase
MEILLVRHGLAGKPDPARFPDDDRRPLTPKGRKAFARAAEALAASGASPRAVYASPARRTVQTAALLADALGLAGGGRIEAPCLHHSFTARKALAGIAALKPPAAFALVGHEPLLGEIAQLLVAGKAGPGMPLRKGGACLLEAPSLSPGRARLLWCLTQDQLVALRRGMKA